MCDHDIFKMDSIDFKRSSFVENEITKDPFPELLIKIVDEIVSTGNAVNRPPSDVSDTERGYLTPAEFHEAVEKRDDNTVIFDVRSHKEFLVGHFDDAIDPEVKNFSEYMIFLDKKIEDIKEKKVLMYCTGGIRCEKASDFLRSKGVQNVYHLKGGIHKYLESFPEYSYFRGKNFVFDKRVTMGSVKEEVVGKCIECQCGYDEFTGKNVCTVCRDMVLVCPSCVNKLLGEYHCTEHQFLKNLYFTYLQYFTEEELMKQANGLKFILDEALKKKGWKRRRQTIRKQIKKLNLRIEDMQNRKVHCEVRNGHHCRTCSKISCKGTCWGFWKDQM